ncbi:hypothetical protein CW749_26940 [Vibrio sp. vnigr-6D03]|uniref:hypothetical protein n=1 Tax=Vibrio sp. vnigr-6D03 TaxID=2058088 RepID=UPI000C349408|nr:hypothetical protein [Vibrio sp. vnigr-6D03]PKF76454.1 hypothetical protein CW749_26940 [Vibrio sp. vnigr-6D03]
MFRFIFILLFFPLVAIAGEPPFKGCQKLGCIGKIESIYLHPSGDIKVPPPGISHGSDPRVVSCTMSEGVYFVLKRTNPHFQEMYSMLLTAKAANNDVYLRVEDGSNECQVRYSVIY